MSIASLLLTVLLLPMVSGADSTVSVNTTWSGNTVLTGNVTVASGATLTVSPGASIDAKDYSIVVEGTMVADQAHFYSSSIPETQGSHGQGLWSGIEVAAGATATFTSVAVSNASAGVLVQGTFSGEDVVFSDAYRGLSVMGGTAVVDGFEAYRIDYEAVYVESGSLNLSDATAEEVAVGLANHGQANVSDLIVSEAGVGVQSQAGVLTLTGLAVFNASVGIATVSGASTHLSSVTGSGMALVVDAGDADDFAIDTASVHGERMLVGQDVSAFVLNEIGFTSTLSSELRPVFDVRCEGTCHLKNSTFDSAPVGLAWSGSGTSVMEHVDVGATGQAVQATGAGHAVWSNITASTSTTGLSVQTPTSSLTDVDITLTSSDAVGVDLLGGQHVLSDVDVHKPFASSDRTSVGLHGWYADLTVDRFTSKNISTGMFLEDSTAVVDSLEANIGSEAGLRILDSSYVGDDLTTIAQDLGVSMEGDSSLHLSSWTAQLHDTPLMMSSENTAIIRSFTPLNTAPSSADALGDGTLYYGSTSNPTVSTSTSYRFTETDVTFTDLSGQPVEAHIAVHGFELMSNSNGALTLPLVGSGSVVDVTLEGAGTRVTLYGGSKRTIGSGAGYSRRGLDDFFRTRRGSRAASRRSTAPTQR